MDIHNLKRMNLALTLLILDFPPNPRRTNASLTSELFPYIQIGFASELKHTHLGVLMGLVYSGLVFSLTTMR